MIGADRDDVIPIVAHLTRIAVRHSNDADCSALIAQICADLCDELDLEPTDIAASAREMAAAMARTA